jgi:beta-phosphoglucomutase-like phosphatase (HAD superfamily)
VKAGKPAPDLFLRAAGHLDVDPSDCLVIEDSVFGVQAAAAAGMRAWGFTGGGHCPAGHGDALLEAGAEAVFAHFDQIAEAYRAG